MNSTDKKEIFGHPAGLFVLFFTEMWERFSYYGMRALLVLFLISEAAIGGWEWSNKQAGMLYAFYTGLVYITPIFGGLLADKVLGHRRTIILGAFLMTLGHASMALETEFFFFAGLVLLILGNGAFKPNISSIVGDLYKNNGEKKDAGYTIFYMGINAGAFLGILLCGYIGEKVGWSYGFGLAGIFMFLGMIQFAFGQKIFGNIGIKLPKHEHPIEDADHSMGARHNDPVTKDKTPDHVVRDRIIVIGILSFFTIFFWWAFEQAGSSMTIFAKSYTDRILTGTSASVFTWLNTILTIVPLAVVTFVLLKLFQKTVKKYPMSVLALGLSFVVIWGIALWMLNTEFSMKAYEVSYMAEDEETKEMVLDTTTVRSAEVFESGKTLHLLQLREKFRIIPEEKVAEFKAPIESTVIRDKGSETEVPASWFGILNSFFIIAFAPLFSRIWERFPKIPGSVKFGIGLILLGLGFAILSFGSIAIPNGAETAKLSMFFLIFAYLLHTLGELCISPVGLSYVSKLAPAKLVGLMFGIWFGATAIANYLGGWTASSIDKISEHYGLAVFFGIFTAIPIAAGLVMIGLTKMMKRMMHGVDG